MGDALYNKRIPHTKSKPSVTSIQKLTDPLSWTYIWQFRREGVILMDYSAAIQKLFSFLGIGTKQVLHPPGCETSLLNVPLQQRYDRWDWYKVQNLT